MRSKPLKVYIHLPKCGGTTVDANLNHHLGDRFFQYVSRDDWRDLQGHVANGFENIDVMTVHNGNFAYDKVLDGVETEFITVCREPVSAAVSMYNFATSATHTRNFARVKDLNFWQFVAYSHKINIWSPNFQCFYLCGSRSWDDAQAFLETYKVRVHTLSDLNAVYKELSGQALDPALDRNRSPKTLEKTDLSETELRILNELFDMDIELWRHAMAQRSASAPVSVVPSVAATPSESPAPMTTEAAEAPEAATTAAEIAVASKPKEKTLEGKPPAAAKKRSRHSAGPKAQKPH